MILTSIIIPVYNCERYVAEAILSCIPALEESKSTELIVIDDGSTDSSLRIAQSFENANQIQVFTQTNQGVSTARNRGIKTSRGSYLKFLDADDTLNPETLRAHVKLLSSSENVDIVYSDFQLLSNKLSQISPLISAAPHNVIDLFLSNLHISSALYRKHSLQAVDGFNEKGCFKVAEDYELNIKLAMAGFQFKKTEGVAFYYRVHSSPSRLTVKKHNMYLDINNDEVSRTNHYMQMLLNYYGTESNIPLTIKTHVGRNTLHRSFKMLCNGRTRNAIKCMSLYLRYKPGLKILCSSFCSFILDKIRSSKRALRPTSTI